MKLKQVYEYLDSIAKCNGRSCRDCKDALGYDECPTAVIGDNGGVELLIKVSDIILNQIYSSIDKDEITVEELANIFNDISEGVT